MVNKVNMVNKISVLAFTALNIKEIRELCKIYDVSILFISGRKIGNSLVPSLIEIDQDKLDNPSVVSATEFTIRSAPGIKILWGDILSPEDKLNKSYNDPIFKSRRWEGKLNNFEKDFSSSEMTKSCQILIFKEGKKFNYLKKNELLRKLGKISEDIEDYD